jgi:hypothetical protein
VVADVISNKRWVPPLPAGRRNYPMNCWWVAAFVDEVGEQARRGLQRWMERETA